MTRRTGRNAVVKVDAGLGEVILWWGSIRCVFMATIKGGVRCVSKSRWDKDRLNSREEIWIPDGPFSDMCKQAGATFGRIREKRAARLKRILERRKYPEPVREKQLLLF